MASGHTHSGLLSNPPHARPAEPQRMLPLSLLFSLHQSGKEQLQVRASFQPQRGLQTPPVPGHHPWCSHDSHTPRLHWPSQQPRRESCLMRTWQGGCSQAQRQGPLQKYPTSYHPMPSSGHTHLHLFFSQTPLSVLLSPPPQHLLLPILSETAQVPPPPGSPP